MNNKRATTAAVLGSLAFCALVLTWLLWPSAPTDPMEFTPGRWESSTGEYWIEIAENPDIVSYRVPANQLFGCESAQTEILQGSLSWYSREGASIDRQLPVSAHGKSKPAFELRVPGDWTVFVEYPCGRDLEPLLLEYVGEA